MVHRIEEMIHIRSIFRQLGGDDPKAIELVMRLRDDALKFLPASVIAKVPPPHFSDEVRASLMAKGHCLEWNLKILGATGVYAFYMALRGVDLTPSQQSAAALLYACTEALEANTLTDQVRQNILDAYAGLDLDAVTTGGKFTRGRKPNTGGPIRKKIASLLLKNPAIKNPELWSTATANLPRGWIAYDNRQGKYLEGPKAEQHMTQQRFFTVCGEERKKHKP